jgi:type III pantothenate kinase
MKKNGFSAEQATGKLREVELLLGQGDEIVRRMKKEVRSNPKVIATGGLAILIAAESETIEEVNKYLAIERLKSIYERDEKSKRRRNLV